MRIGAEDPIYVHSERGNFGAATLVMIDSLHCLIRKVQWVVLILCLFGKLHERAFVPFSLDNFAVLQCMVVLVTEVHIKIFIF